MPRLRPILECADKAKIAISPSSEVITVDLVFYHNGPIAEGLTSNIVVRGIARSMFWKNLAVQPE
jgi:sorbitol-specific phosphotransferase system component IIBC